MRYQVKGLRTKFNSPESSAGADVQNFLYLIVDGCEAEPAAKESLGNLVLQIFSGFSK